MAQTSRRRLKALWLQRPSHLHQLWGPLALLLSFPWSHPQQQTLAPKASAVQSSTQAAPAAKAASMAPEPKPPSCLAVVSFKQEPVKQEPVEAKQESLNTRAAALRGVCPRPTVKPETCVNTGEGEGGAPLDESFIRAEIEKFSADELTTLLGTMENHPRFVEYLGEVMDECLDPEYRFGFYEPVEDAIHFACWLEAHDEKRPPLEEPTEVLPQPRKSALKKTAQPKPPPPVNAAPKGVEVHRVSVGDAAQAGSCLQGLRVHAGLHPGELQ